MKTSRRKNAGRAGVADLPTILRHNVRLKNIVYHQIDALSCYDRSLRQHSQAKRDSLKASVASFGLVLPIPIDAKRTIIGGEALVQAARDLGYTEVPTVEIDHLEEPDIRLLRIALNRLSEGSEWDLAELKAEFTELLALDIDLGCEVSGFSSVEIDNLIQGEDPQEDPDDVLDSAGYSQAFSRPDDIWRVGPHSVLNASSLEPDNLARLMGGERAQMVFTDAPYNLRISGHVSGLGKHRHREFAQASGEMDEAEFTAFLTRSTSALASVCHDGALLYFCMDHRHIWEMVSAIRSAGLEHNNLAVWVKKSGGMGSLYRSQHELIFIAKKGDAPSRNNVQLGRFGRNRTNCWFYPGVNSFGRDRDELLASHPTPKNCVMVADAIRDVTDRGEIILDGFLGSGTTLIAAERTGRICRGVELDPLYVDGIIRRWEKVTGGQATLQATGETFDAVVARRGLGSDPTKPETYARPRTRTAA